jgi:hypothetical protein
MQYGSLIKTKRRSGQSVWEFRWRDRTSGKAVYRRIVIGTTQKIATEDEARGIVEGIVFEINSGDPLADSCAGDVSVESSTIVEENSRLTTRGSRMPPRWVTRII